MHVTNTGNVPIALPASLGEMMPGETIEVADRDWDRAKDNGVVRNWLSSGRLRADEFGEPETAGSDDDDVEAALEKNASDAFDELKALDASDIAYAIELEKKGKNRKGLVSDLEKLLTPEE